MVQNPSKKKQLVKACLGQLAAKTASELIVCVARTDRVDEMAKRNISEFPFPEAPAMVQKYYRFIPYNYKTGYFNALGNFKKVAFKVARTLDKQLSAIQEVQKELEIPVHALITMKDLMDYLDAKGEKEALANMQAYREKYGI